MKKRTLAFLIFNLVVPSAFAQATTSENVDPIVILEKGQQREDFGTAVRQIVYNHIDHVALSSSPKDRFYPVCLAISIDENGKTTGVFTSMNLSPVVKKFLKRDQLLDAMQKKLTNIDARYRSKTVIVPIMFIRATTEAILFNTEFVNNISNMWPDFPPDKSRSVVLIDPLFMRFDFPIIRN